jgi:signal transduction histidine kinase
MTLQPTPSERIIAGARLVLAITAIALGFVYEEPLASDPAHTVLVFYFVYALVVVGIVDRGLMRPERLAFATQFADTLWFPLIVLKTQGDNSPFFLCYVFSLITAGFRWGFRGTLFVNTANVGMYLAVHLATTASEFSFQAFMVRPIYLYVLACLIGYLAEHQKRSQSQLIWLAEVSGSLPLQVRFSKMLQETMEHVRRLFRAEQCILVVEEPERLKITVRKVGKGRASSHFQLSGMRPEDLEFLVAPRSNLGYLVNPHRWVARVFGLRDVMHYDFETQRVISDGLRPNSRLVTLFEMESLLSAPVYIGAEFRGRVYLVNRPSENFSVQELQFLKLIVSQLAPLLENFRLLHHMQKMTVLEEKNRIARDLHDGLLQSLASLDLRVAACRRLYSDAPTEILQELEGLQCLVRDEHRELRNYTKRLKTPSFADHELAAALRQYVETFQRENALTVTLDFPPHPLSLSRAVNREIYNIVLEALTNVRKHALASQVCIQIQQDDQGTYLTVEDNGRGFSEARTLADLRARKPWSIEGRTRSLKGTLQVESKPGLVSILRIFIPYDERTQSQSFSPQRQESVDNVQKGN